MPSEQDVKVSDASGCCRTKSSRSVSSAGGESRGEKSRVVVAAGRRFGKMQIEERLLLSEMEVSDGNGNSTEAD